MVTGFDAASLVPSTMNQEFLCAVCKLVSNEPQKLECGYFFCNDCISMWCAIEPTCPVCRREDVSILPLDVCEKFAYGSLRAVCPNVARGCPLVL